VPELCKCKNETGLLSTERNPRPARPSRVLGSRAQMPEVTARPFAAGTAARERQQRGTSARGARNEVSVEVDVKEEEPAGRAARGSRRARGS